MRILRDLVLVLRLCELRSQIEVCSIQKITIRGAYHVGVFGTRDIPQPYTTIRPTTDDLTGSKAK